jgi:hypothetical protein
LVVVLVVVARIIESNYNRIRIVQFAMKYHDNAVRMITNLMILIILPRLKELKGVEVALGL